MNKNLDFLGAGDPGALDFLLQHLNGNTSQKDWDIWFAQFSWLYADINPLKKPKPLPEFVSSDPDAKGHIEHFCGTIGWEIGHILNEEKRHWLLDAAKTQKQSSVFTIAEAFELLCKAEAFEAITKKRLPTIKTFSMEGGEGFLVAVESVIKHAQEINIVLGGMHRGRMTQNALLFGASPEDMIGQIQGKPDLPYDLGASSDVPYHLGVAGKRSDDKVIWLSPHPSHLSVVAPVAMGYARGQEEQCLSIMLHTDAAFAGQGVNMELLQLSGLDGYQVGGSIHLILNNQIGFTTLEEQARTARNSSDIARMLDIPILHVHGDDIVSLIKAGFIAVEYRRQFATDVVIEVLCTRRRGHNEIDDPSYTAPIMQQQIDARPPITTITQRKYQLTQPDISDFNQRINDAFNLDNLSTDNQIPDAPGLVNDVEAVLCKPVKTGIMLDKLIQIGEQLTTWPHEFTIHPRVAQLLTKRAEALRSHGKIDWGFAETLALGGLLDEGYSVRLSGQDTVRGAFSQRHLHIYDQNVGTSFEPLSQLGDAEIFNSPLIENAVLGFEYGLSVSAPNKLVIWEAQFGDFLNVCQAMFDQFVTGGEDRWLQQSRLVMLLPHGFDGGGPDHSTGHIERVLSRAARGNVRVANPTTPANYFHLLRRQMHDHLAKPLVIFSPKLLLRHPLCLSDVDHFTKGHFETFKTWNIENAQQIAFCHGKMAVRMLEECNKRDCHDWGIVSLEQLYPLDRNNLLKLRELLSTKKLFFVEEEPANLGAFTYLDRKLESIFQQTFHRIGRPEAASPAVGWKSWHDKEENLLWTQIFGNNSHDKIAR